MEKISAACAMEWSIELEKGLRSKKPGQSIEAIKSIGPRLQKWSMEPSITVAITDMYGLVPGVDRSFANTILLRLADAFKCGDNYTRSCILEVFLLELRHLRKKGKRYNGILAKQRVPNYVELLKRVKTVFDTGDNESKALALRLFGCLADLAKDSPQIRYMILLNLQSSHVLEVKASLFAAGCFCLLSDDFACIVLEFLIDIISSLQTPSEVIFSAIRVFSKMRCSYSIASRAYKAGKKLVMGSLQEEFKVEMLSSLSILAFRSSILYSEQVDLLFSCLRGERASIVKARALKCLYFLLLGRRCQFPVNRSDLEEFFLIVDDNDLPLNSQCEALRILCKIFCSMLADVPYMDMPDLLRLVRIVEKAAQSSAEEKRCLALRLLVVILCSLKREWGGHSCPPSERMGSPTVSLVASRGGDPELLVSYVTSSILHYIESLVKQMFTGHGTKLIHGENFTSKSMESTKKQKCKTLLGLVLRLAKVYPSSGLEALDGIRCLIEILVTMDGTFSNRTYGPRIEMVAEKQSSVIRNPNSDNKEYSNNFSELISWICKFVNVCLDILDETDVNGEAYQKVKLLVEHIEHNGSCDYYAYDIFYLCMRSSIACHYERTTDNRTRDLNQPKDDPKLGFIHDVCWVCEEWRTLDFIKNMVRRRNNWEAYRAGKYSCCKGLWFAATFSFRKLIDFGQSDSCRCWLRSLMLLCGGESELKLIISPKNGIKLIDGLQTENDTGKPFSCVGSGVDNLCVDINADWRDYEGKLAQVYGKISSSEEILTAVGASNGVFYFQRWFLSLRAKVLETLIDSLGFLVSRVFNNENLNGSVEGSSNIHSTAVAQKLHSLLSSSCRISLRWNRLAKEYDLLATSFPDIDPESFRNISSLALNCSLLSFSTTFALYFSRLPAYESYMHHSFSNLGNFSPAVVLRDLVERLSNMDEDITAELEQFMASSGEVIDSFQSRTHTTSNGSKERAFFCVCKFAISGVLHIQEAAKGASDEELFVLIMRGKQLISDTTRKWMGISFKIPKFFFRVRPCVGAELFIFNGDPRNTNEICCTSGSQLSLNICVQIKNASIKPYVQVDKVYSILATRSSDHSSPGIEERAQQKLWNFQARNTGDMVELADLLLMYMTTETRGSSRMHVEAISSADLVTTFVSTELNEKGQGFSSCVLDVSAFPEGSYTIKWHSCCFHNNGSLWSLIPVNSSCMFTIRSYEGSKPNERL